MVFCLDTWRQHGCLAGNRQHHDVRRTSLRCQGRFVREALTITQNSGAYAFMPRMFSLLLAMSMAGVIFTYPKALEHINHGILSLIMLGICAGFVHGVGFIQKDKLWRVLFGPWMAWGLMIMGLWILLKN